MVGSRGKTPNMAKSGLNATKSWKINKINKINEKRRRNTESVENWWKKCIFPKIVWMAEKTTNENKTTNDGEKTGGKTA